MRKNKLCFGLYTQPLFGVLLFCLFLAACTPSPPQTLTPQPVQVPVAPPAALPSVGPVVPPPVLKPTATLPARSVRLNLKADANLLKSFGIKQTSDLTQCTTNLTNVLTTLTFPSILPPATQTSLQAAGITVTVSGSQTILEFSNTLAQLTANTAGLDYTLNDLPLGDADGQTHFKDGSGQELGFINYTVSVTGTTGTSVAISLLSNGIDAALVPCPRLEAQLTGATLLTTGGDITATAPAPTPTPTPTATPSVTGPAITTLSATSGSPLTAITITGTHFTGAYAVKFGGANAASFTVVNDTQITALVPAGFATAAVTVSGVGGTATSTDLFTLVAPVGVRTLMVQASAGANGDGTSWATALNRLEVALAVAQSGDEIWVAEGTYRPALAGSNRASTFTLKSNVAVYGGFSGSETLRTQRDPDTHQTILSGDMTGNDDYSDAVFTDLNDNSYHVVTGATLALLDGVTIQGGNANSINPNDRGGGMYNQGSSPTLTAVRIIDNRSGYLGGGMYNSDGASPVMTKCSFNNNVTVQAGGAIYNVRGASPTLNQGTIAFNSAKMGGGIYNEGVSPTITNLSIVANTAKYFGGGLCNMKNASPTLTQISFENNTASLGAGIYNSDSSSPSLNQGNFLGNKADNGGGVFNYNNSAPTFQQVVFKGNRAKYAGGGMYNYKSNGPSATLTQVVFTNNTATEGGGLANRSGVSPTLTNVVFSGNVATTVGGGISNYLQTSPKLKHVTLYNNTAATGPEIYADQLSSLTMTNSIVWNATATNAIVLQHSSSLTPINSVIKGLANLPNTGFGNLNQDPNVLSPGLPTGSDGVFLTADDGLRLADTSIALNYGATANMPLTDVLGVTRDTPPDLGAYEGGFVPPAPTLQIQDTVVGTGAMAGFGNTVTVHYTGWLIDGTQFDTSIPGPGFTFTIGGGTVIQGWEQGIQGMKEGGTRRLVIPPNLAYGAAGFGAIPPNATILFEIQLLTVL